MVDLLRQLGLSDPEVEVYQYLLHAGAAAPSTVARETNQPRGRIYETMRGMAGRGFLREQPVRPIRFTPKPLADVLAAAEARLARHVEVAKRARSELPPLPEPGKATPVRSPARVRDIRTFAGRRACLAEMTRLLSRARTFFWLSGGRGFMERFSNIPRLHEQLRRVAARGVDVRLFFPVPETPTPSTLAIEGLLGAHVEFVPGLEEAGPVVSCANERSSLQIFAQPDDAMPNRGQDVGFEVAVPVHADHMRRALDRQRLALSHGDQAASRLEVMSGARLRGLLREALRTAAHEVAVLLPRRLLAGDADIENDALRTRARGVTLRALVTGPAPEHGALPPAWDTRDTSPGHSWFWVADRRRLVEARARDADGTFLVRRSLQGQDIEFHRDAFEDAWAKAGRRATDEASVRRGPPPEPALVRSAAP